MHTGTSFLMISTVSLTGSAAESQSKHKLQQISRRFFLSFQEESLMDVLPEELISMASQQTRLHCQEPQERTVNLIMAPCHSMAHTADPQSGTGSAHSAQQTEHFRAIRAWVS